jgi:hypothetical protein
MKSPPFPNRPTVLQYWFPVLLGFLLLLCVPCAVLLLLHLLGYENEVNGWMEQHLSLSYHIPIPAWAALVLLLMPFLIALLYFLKLKRKPIQVPSTYLWRKSIQDMHVNSFFQWLKQNVLLLIQVMIVLLVIFGVMGFQVHGSTKLGKHYILMIDSSASMSVRDGTPTRLDAAKQAAINEINAHADDDVGMVIEFNSTAAIRQLYTTDRGLLRLAVEKIVQTERTTHIEEALALAGSLANPTRSTANQAVSPEDADPSKARTYVDVELESVPAEVHLFSDGRFPDATEFAAGNLDLHYHRVGKEGPDQDNIGIVNFNAVRDPEVIGKVQVFVRVLNFGSKSVKTRVELEVRGKNLGEIKRYVKPDEDDVKKFPALFPDGQPLLELKPREVKPGDPDAKKLPVDRPGEGVVTFEVNDVDDSDNITLHAKLVDNKDAFRLDDEAWLVIGVVRKARVCIVTPGNEILHNFFDLEATGKVATVKFLTPQQLDDEKEYRKPAREGGFDLVIFDRCAPATEEALPLANTLFIDEVPLPWKRSEMKPMADVLGPDEAIVVRNPTSKHPLMRGLTGLDEIPIARQSAFHFDLTDPRVPPRTPRLLEIGKERAVMVALPRRAFTDVVMTFPLINNKGEWCTKWPLKLSFPLFLRNLLYTYGNVSDAATEPNVQPGELVRLRPDTSDPEIELFTPESPDARPERLERNSQGEFAFKNTERVGVYRAAWPGGGRLFAVNLLDAEESNIQPRDIIVIGSTNVESGKERGSVHETWKWVAVAALALLLLEYALYHRRVFA